MWKKLVLAFVVMGILAFSGILLSMRFAYPRVTISEAIPVAKDEASLKNGAYLADAVAACTSCHSTRDWSRWGGPVKEGAPIGAGGEVFDGPENPFRLVAPNITPHSLKGWSVSDRVQALRKGVTPTGHVSFPLMPWSSYAHFTKEDLSAVLAWMESLPEVQTTHPPSEVKFPLSLLVRTLPADLPYDEVMDPKDELARGAYLVRVAACADCHTPQNRGEPLKEPLLAGGYLMSSSQFRIRSANITPDRDTGIGSWSRERFIARFRELGLNPMPVERNKQTPMPWSNYARMSDKDLGAIYTWLMAQKPVSYEVQIHPMD